MIRSAFVPIPGSSGALTALTMAEYNSPHYRNVRSGGETVKGSQQSPGLSSTHLTAGRRTRGEGV